MCFVLDSDRGNLCMYSSISRITGICWEHMGLSSTRKPLSGFRMLCTGEGACSISSTVRGTHWISSYGGLLAVPCLKHAACFAYTSLLMWHNWPFCMCQICPPKNVFLATRRIYVQWLRMQQNIWFGRYAILSLFVKTIILCISFHLFHFMIFV